MKKISTLFLSRAHVLFFNKEVHSQHVCLCASNEVNCAWVGISKGMPFKQNGKEAFFHEVTSPSHHW